MLVSWTGSDGMRYVVEDFGRGFRLTATGNVIRSFEDTIADAGRAEWLCISDAERTDWAELLLGNG